MRPGLGWKRLFSLLLAFAASDVAPFEEHRNCESHVKRSWANLFIKSLDARYYFLFFPCGTARACVTFKNPMKLAGFFLLVAGWIIALTAIVLLPSPGARTTFLLAGIAVEAAGLVLVFRSHLPAKEARG